ncbi:ATP-binding protein [Mycoplasma procyoni]|uniref:ATP-binding protein n=1 Tax=Mycoplasma procyoni TaxID=568784 RepID=UPI00197C15E7|nr:ATP-binding protein [Mycoplasma procyoni]MBN3534694.1 hypothetical protein [Mycoplasma procyoni]
MIHRDYLIKGSEIFVYIFDNRIEIVSPGGMFDRLKIQDLNIQNIHSSLRNPIIANVFSELDLMKRRGMDFDKIINSYKKEENFSEDKMPTFYSDEYFFKTTLWNLNYQKNNSNNITINTDTAPKKTPNLNFNHSWNKKKKDIFWMGIENFLNQKETITSKEAQEILGTKSSRTREVLANFTKEGLLISFGANKNRFYKLNKENKKH